MATSEDFFADVESVLARPDFPKLSKDLLDNGAYIRYHGAVDRTVFFDVHLPKGNDFPRLNKVNAWAHVAEQYKRLVVDRFGMKGIKVIYFAEGGDLQANDLMEFVPLMNHVPGIW